MESVAHTDAIIMGDLNFAMDSKTFYYMLQKPILNQFDLHVCMKLTFLNYALGLATCTDRLKVSSNSQAYVKGINVVDSAVNYSDHRPVNSHLNINCAPSLSIGSSDAAKVNKV